MNRRSLKRRIREQRLEVSRLGLGEGGPHRRANHLAADTELRRLELELKNMDASEITDHITSGATTAGQAVDLRKNLRRRTKPGNEEREASIRAMLDLIDEEMKPIRSLVGRIVYDDTVAMRESELRRVSARLQHERRQLKKMLRGSRWSG